MLEGQPREGTLVGLGLGNERVIGAKLRQTAVQSRRSRAAERSPVC